MTASIVQNPCRSTVFDVFGLDKSEVSLRAVRRAIQAARDEIGYHRGEAGVGLTEAQLNTLQATLLDPVARLKAEQFVHQQHRFSEDEAVASALSKLAEAMPDLRDELAGLAQNLILGRLLHALPEPEPTNIDDDLPWPDPPGPRPADREGLAESILRER